MKKSLKILLCCEHFYPSVGGVQKMMQEIGSRFVQMGHSVSAVTSYRSDRKVDSIDGIKIYSFDISGNAVKGMHGPVAEYQDFLIKGDFDFLLVMAAQQWTLDAMLPVLTKIPYKKLHIPCGYSCFYLKEFEGYYQEMIGHLKNFDHLIYNAQDYRDINFAKKNNIPNLHFIPAGASEQEFQFPVESNVLEELGIGHDEFIFLSVGAPAYHKGHKEVLRAYLKAKLPQKSVLILNGDYQKAPQLSSGLKNYLKEIAKWMLGKSSHNIVSYAERNTDPNKRVLFTNLERHKLISLFFKSHLFLFASHIEYSPLVIYEAMASSLPFIAGPVGNLEEIVEWSHGGVIVKATKSKEGRTYVDLKDFISKIEALSQDEGKRKKLGEAGRMAWEQKFTWKVIAEQIEALVTKN